MLIAGKFLWRESGRWAWACDESGKPEVLGECEVVVTTAVTDYIEVVPVAAGETEILRVPRSNIISFRAFE
jgi:hypothetical protein